MKKILIICLLVFVAISSFANGSGEKKAGDIEQTEKKPKVTEKKAGTGQTKSQATVQVLLPIPENLSNTESAWLPGQIQDKLKANMQEYLGVRTVVDSNAERSLKQLQAESESGARDANTAIELGKITTAKYGLFSKIRKTGYGYSLSVDYTDLTTGEQIASATSKEYSKAEYLYGSTGAVDEVTLALANKLDIKLNDLTRNLLASGSADFSVDAQMALAKQNEEHYQKLMNQYDDELKKLSTSSDLSAVEKKKKIEAEKALLTEKQRTEKKRLAELAEQKQQAESDAKLESERSIELKTQRDNLAKQAAAKAEEVRKLKLDKQGVLGQIAVIESKKKALVEIRQAVEAQCIEFFEQMKIDKISEEDKIRKTSWNLVELKDGQPTEAAKQRRDNLVAENNRYLEEKFITDCEKIIKAANSQDNELMTEIRSDSSKLAIPRKVNSLGDELKISYGTYDGEKLGWNAYLSIYSDGVNIFNDQFIVEYKSLTGKPAPDITIASNKEMDEYIANTDMYNSLLTRGDPILYFELDFSVKAENDKPSQYIFNFDTIHGFNTVSGKEVQTTKLNKNMVKNMNPKLDLRRMYSINSAKLAVLEERNKEEKTNKLKKILLTLNKQNYISFERTAELYELIMCHNLIKEGASWYDAVFFCNKMSMLQKLEPFYSVNGTTDIDKWGYEPNLGLKIDKKVSINAKANGYRLLTESESCQLESRYINIKGDDFYFKYLDNVRNEQLLSGKWFDKGCYSIFLFWDGNVNDNGFSLKEAIKRSRERGGGMSYVHFRSNFLWDYNLNPSVSYYEKLDNVIIFSMIRNKKD